MRRLGPPPGGLVRRQGRKQIHDLDAETSNCRIDEIIAQEALSFQSSKTTCSNRNCVIASAPELMRRQLADRTDK